MKILFDEKAKEGLQELINKSSEQHIRIKPFYGCGRPAYEIYPDFKRDTDIEEVIEDISFIVNIDDEKSCSELQIKYDKDVYNNGFYIK